jgi:hypothetical protein
VPTGKIAFDTNIPAGWVCAFDPTNPNDSKPLCWNLPETSQTIWEVAHYPGDFNVLQIDVQRKGTNEYMIFNSNNGIGCPVWTATEGHTFSTRDVGTCGQADNIFGWTADVM